MRRAAKWMVKHMEKLWWAAGVKLGLTAGGISVLGFGGALLAAIAVIFCSATALGWVNPRRIWQSAAALALGVPAAVVGKPYIEAVHELLKGHLDSPRDLASVTLVFSPQVIFTAIALMVGAYAAGYIGARFGAVLERRYPRNSVLL